VLPNEHLNSTYRFSNLESHSRQLLIRLSNAIVLMNESMTNEIRAG
jgi:hypothetical protein